jgi:hypothetical protein
MSFRKVESVTPSSSVEEDSVKKDKSQNSTCAARNSHQNASVNTLCTIYTTTAVIIRYHLNEK